MSYYPYTSKTSTKKLEDEGMHSRDGVTRFSMSAMPPSLVLEADEKVDHPPSHITRDPRTIARPSGDQVVYFITAELGSGRLPSLYHVRPNGDGVRLRLQHDNGPRQEVIPNVMHHSYDTLAQRNSAADQLRRYRSIRPKNGGHTGLRQNSHHLEFDTNEFDPTSDPHRHVHKSGGMVQRLTTVVSAEDFRRIEQWVTDLHNLLVRIRTQHGRDSTQFREAAREANNSTEDFLRSNYPALHAELRAKSPLPG